MTLKFKYEDFLMEDIPNLMINIWSYSDDHGVGCIVCTTYKKFCIDALKKKWDNKKYKDVNEIIQKLKKRDKNWFNLSKLSSVDRHFLYYLIEKDSSSNNSNRFFLIKIYLE